MMMMMNLILDASDVLLLANGFYRLHVMLGLLAFQMSACSTPKIPFQVFQS